MTDNRRGPWDEKLRDYITELKVVVLVHNLLTDEIDYEFKLDYGNPEDRKFLGRLSFWCVNNGRSVETLAAKVWERMPK